jgi:hypothetical protein
VQRYEKILIYARKDIKKDGGKAAGLEWNAASQAAQWTKRRRGAKDPRT